MNSEEMKETIRAFIMKRVDIGKVKDSDNLFKLGFVDSMFVLELVSFIESEFRIAVEDEDLEVENFTSVDAIQEFIREKEEQSRS